MAYHFASSLSARRGSHCSSDKCQIPCNRLMCYAMDSDSEEHGRSPQAMSRRLIASLHVCVAIVYSTLMTRDNILDFLHYMPHPSSHHHRPCACRPALVFCDRLLRHVIIVGSIHRNNLRGTISRQDAEQQVVAHHVNRKVAATRAPTICRGIPS